MLQPTPTEDPRHFFLTLDALKAEGIEVPPAVAALIWQSARAFHQPDPGAFERYGEWRLGIARAARRLRHE